MSTTTKAPGPGTRRERRIAERAGAISTRRAHPTGSRGRGSPIFAITLLVGTVGIALVAGLFMLQGFASPDGTTAATLTAPRTATPITLAADRTLGDPAAPVTLELWTDFQCPICGQFARTVEPALVSTYVTNGTLRIVHNDAAFQGAKSDAAYDESVEAAAGARCAAIQGLYWPYQDWTFANQAGENQGAFAAERLSAIATAAGLDVGAWQACVATGDQQRAVRAETSQAVAAGVGATPTLRINGQPVVGLRSIGELSKMIDAAAAVAAGG